MGDLLIKFLFYKSSIKIIKTWLYVQNKEKY